MISEDNYIDIQGWMLTDLGLQGKELMTYAIIYGFSQDGAGWFFGGRKYVADWLGCNVKTAGTLLTNMVKKGLIIREEVKSSEGKCYKYQTIRHRAKIALPTGNNEPTRGENRPNLGAKMSHITTSNDYKEDKKRERRFSKPTLEELRDYISEKGYHVDPERFMAYYESNGWMVGRSKMKDWKASVRYWESGEKGKANEIVSEYADLF